MIGKKWSSFTEDEKFEMIKTAHAVNGVSGNPALKDGLCIIDLDYPYSIPGELVNGEIVISNDAVVYCGV